MLPWQRNVGQRSYQKSEVCVVNLRVFWEKGDWNTGIKTAFGHLNGDEKVKTSKTDLVISKRDAQSTRKIDVTLKRELTKTSKLIDMSQRTFPRSRHRQQCSSKIVVRPIYSATRRIFDSVLGVCKCGQTPCSQSDASSQRKLKLRRKWRKEIVKVDSD